MSVRVASHAACHEVVGMHISSRGVQSWSHGRFPRPPCSPSPACRQSRAVYVWRLASEHSRGGPSSAHWPAINFFLLWRVAPPRAYLVTSRQASLAPTTHALTIVAAGHLFSQCPASMQGPIPPAHNLISGTLRANEARAIRHLCDSQRGTGDNIVHARCAWRLNGRRKRKRGTKGRKLAVEAGLDGQERNEDEGKAVRKASALSKASVSNEQGTVHCSHAAESLSRQRG